MHTTYWTSGCKCPWRGHSVNENRPLLSPHPQVGCEINFPVHEAIVTGLMSTLAQWVSVGLTALEYKMVPGNAKWRVPLGAAALYVVVLLCLIAFRADLKKRKLDRTRPGDTALPALAGPEPPAEAPPYPTSPVPLRTGPAAL